MFSKSSLKMNKHREMFLNQFLVDEYKRLRLCVCLGGCEILLSFCDKQKLN